MDNYAIKSQENRSFGRGLCRHQGGLRSIPRHKWQRGESDNTKADCVITNMDLSQDSYCGTDI